MSHGYLTGDWEHDSKRRGARATNGLNQLIDVQLRSIGIDPGNVTPKDRQAIWDKWHWLCQPFNGDARVAESGVIREATITGLGHERIAALRET
jgi:hypothetical protein